MNNENKKYYTIKEIIDFLNKECGLNRKKRNSDFQWFYRRSIPYILIKVERNRNAKGYDEEAANEIKKYFINRRLVLEYKKEIKKLHAENNRILEKYPKKEQI